MESRVSSLHSVGIPQSTPGYTLSACRDVPSARICISLFLILLFPSRANKQMENSIKLHPNEYHPLYLIDLNLCLLSIIYKFVCEKDSVTPNLVKIRDTYEFLKRTSATPNLVKARATHEFSKADRLYQIWLKSRFRDNS